MIKDFEMFAKIFYGHQAYFEFAKLVVICSFIYVKNFKNSEQYEDDGPTPEEIESLIN